MFDVNGEKQVEALAEECNTSEEIARIRQRLAALDAERLALTRDLEALEQKRISDRQAAEQSKFADAIVTNNSSSAEKSNCSAASLLGVPTFFRFDGRTERRVVQDIRQPARTNGRRGFAASRK
jgi:hypothetical protein